MASHELIFSLSVLLPLGFGFAVWGYINFRRGWSDSFTPQRNQVVPHGATPTTTTTTTTTTATTTTAEQPSAEDASLQRQRLQEHRMQALELIFPTPLSLTPTLPSSHPCETPSLAQTIYLYDIEAKKYVTMTNDSLVLNSSSCSICLEDFDNTAFIVTGGCQHSYHRHCILNWVRIDHDDCPNCRAKMWDPEEMERLMLSLLSTTNK